MYHENYFIPSMANNYNSVTWLIKIKASSFLQFWANTQNSLKKNIKIKQAVYDWTLYFHY